MNTIKLQVIAVTTDQTISQILHDLDGRLGLGIVLFSDPARVFSASLDDLHFLLIDEAAAGANYMSVIRKARKRFPSLDTMVVGGPKSDDVRQTEKRQGVDSYFERPIDETLLAATVERRLSLARVKAGAGIVGRSSAIEEILAAVLQVGPTEVPILIEGESGTGKDVIARAIHMASRRSEGPYVAINVASLAEGVLESELFGHEKGAFTGAVAQRQGVFERANGGTIFLDEVGEMSANMQVRLLRVLESGEVLRVGGAKNLKVDVRVVAATNRNLSQAVDEGTFRQDLYYRLRGVNLHLPPLRERKGDIPLLVDHFVREANRKHEKSVKGVDAEALRMITENHWPGNIRELRNLIDTTVVLADGHRVTAQLVASQLGSGDRWTADTLLPVPVRRSKDEAEREMIYASVLALHRDVREILSLLRSSPGGAPFEALREVRPDEGQGNDVPSLADLERRAILEALRTTAGNRRQASDMLGISERTLYRKIKEYGLD